jgi:hypothetical protein
MRRLTIEEHYVRFEVFTAVTLTRATRRNIAEHTILQENGLSLPGINHRLSSSTPLCAS